MKSRILVAAVFVALAAAPPFASAGPLFFENFQSYAAGSNLIGQGGWTGGTTGGAVGMYVGTGHLPSMLLDGRNMTGLDNIHWADHALADALDPLMTTVLSFDAYAVSTNPPSTNSGVGFGVGAQTNPAVSVPLYWDIQAPAGWSFNYRLPGQDYRFTFGTSYDKALNLSIVVDGPAGKVYGLYDDGSGPVSTPQYDITASLIASLTHASLFMDFQGGIYGSSPCTYQYYPGSGTANDCRGGPELDNLLVTETAVPEPTSMILLGTGLAGLVGRAWRKRRS